MKVKLNDKEYEIIEGTTLVDFIESLGLKHQGMAIAINSEVIPKSQWSKTILESNTEMMLIHAVSGG
jgi:sulfur carrier protein